MAHIAMVLKGDIRYDGRVRKEIRTLVDAGHHVELLASDFSRNASSEEGLGATVHYIPTTLWSNPVANFVEQLVFNRKAAAMLQKIRPTHIHCHDLSSLLSGVWAKKKVNAHLVFDAHELMPESFSGIRQKIWGLIEKSSIKSCDDIIIPEKNRLSYFKTKYPLIPEPLLLPNYPRMMDIPRGGVDLFRNIYPIKTEQRIILYTGLIARFRHVEELIESMCVCSEEFALIILGESFKGYDWTLRRKVNDLNLGKKVFFHGAVSHAEILRYMASCDIGTAFYRNTDLNNYYCASNKLYEYIGLEKPVITNNYPGLVEAVERFRQGICLKEITPESLAEGYFRAIDPRFVSPGSKKFFWEDQEHRLVELYER